MKSGLSGLLEFTNFLKSHKITYSIHQYSDDSLTVFFTVVGARFEVTFFEDSWNFSHFPGSEECLDDEKELMGFISEGWDLKD
jgi:hypothetical protein